MRVDARRTNRPVCRHYTDAMIVATSVCRDEYDRLAALAALEGADLPDWVRDVLAAQPGDLACGEPEPDGIADCQLPRRHALLPHWWRNPADPGQIRVWRYAPPPLDGATVVADGAG